MRIAVNATALTVLFFASAQARAFELGAGGGFVTPGDDRLIPAIHSWMSLGQFVFASTFVGEKNSAFSQQTSFPRLSYMTSLGQHKTLQVSAGLGGVISRTRITNWNSDNENRTKTSVSTGLALGLGWEPSISRQLRFYLHWDSFFIPPGLSVIYLTFGHMQSVTTGLGWEF